MKFNRLFILLALPMLFAGCKKQQKSPDIIAPPEVKEEIVAPIAMQSYHQEHHVEWLGKTYSIVIDRVPQDSLPMSVGENGQKYIDNAVTLAVFREDDSIVLKRRFTKKDFAHLLTPGYQSRGILEALVFDEVDDGCLKFAVSVAYPQSDDEFVPMEMKVKPDGSIKIELDDDMDVRGLDD